MGKISGFFNFDNIAKKIKGVTKWCCWISILLIWIATPGAIFILYDMYPWDALFLIPIPVAIIAPFVIWVSCWPMYAFGEMLERICNIDDNTLKDDKKSSAQRESERKKINKLEELRAKGLITEEEYNKTIEQIH